VIETLWARLRQANRLGVAHRLVQAGLLVTLLWKWMFFLAASIVYLQVELADPFFPAFLRSGTVWITTFATTVLAIGFSLFSSRTPIIRFCGVLAFAGLTVLCIHQASYNDATFTTAWWTSLWALWCAWHLDDVDQASTLRRGAFLGRLIVSLILLGGAVGKWTPEYWSGEVLFDIYFRDRDFWLFNLLRDRFDVGALQAISMWYSRGIVVVETIAGFGLWLLPPRSAAILGVTLLAGIALFSNFLLFSVLSCLIALSAVGFLVPSHQTESSCKIRAT
jgi:hypothetical protein